jgi:PhnB protein
MNTSHAAHGTHTTHGRPTRSTSLTPHIVATPATRALDFYRDVLGARVLDVMRLPKSDLVAHAELEFEVGRLTVSDALDAYGLVAHDAAKGATFSLALYVRDVDAVTTAAVAAGARLREPPATFVSGDRFASIVDPFGVRWSLMTRVEDLSDDESRARVMAWSASQG